MGQKQHWGFNASHYWSSVPLPNSQQKAEIPYHTLDIELGLHSLLCREQLCQQINAHTLLGPKYSKTAV